MIKSIHTILLALIILCLATLSGCKNNDSEKYLRNLQSDNPKVIQEAVYYLGSERDTGAVPFLTDLIKTTEFKDIKTDAIEALGDIGSGSAVGILLEVLKDPDVEVKKSAVEALGKIRDVSAVQPLIELLSEPPLCLTAIWALGNIADKSAVDALTPLLRHDTAFIRFNASQSLKKIGQAN